MDGWMPGVFLLQAAYMPPPRVMGSFEAAVQCYRRELRSREVLPSGRAITLCAGFILFTDALYPADALSRMQFWTEENLQAPQGKTLQMLDVKRLF